MKYTWPTDEQLTTLDQRRDDSRTITMLNLLRYRERADYSEHPDETPCSGREAYARYADQAIACVESVGGRLVFGGGAAANAIGPDDEQWDDVLIVEYPNANAFFEMMTSERYQAFAYHRTAAVDDSRLVPMTAGEMNYLK